MSISVPSPQELLSFAPIAHYGDGVSASERGGYRHLSAVLPALSAAIGAPISTDIIHDSRAAQHALALPSVRSAIVVLVDGLGFWNLAQNASYTQYVRHLLNESINTQPIATCIPSTTTAAMATFGTGTCPGLTSMVGYTQLNEKTGKLGQLIQFRDMIDPLDLQREPTGFEKLAEAGAHVCSVGLPKFKHSPLTQAALRGADYRSSDQPAKRVLAACDSARTNELTYLYIRDTDKVGHSEGWQSDHWLHALESVDSQLALLRRNAPKGTLIVITADHGMVNADPAQRIDIAQELVLQQDVRLVGGEPRAPMLYATHSSLAPAIRDRWQQRLGDQALVLLRNEAIERGIFGEVSDRTRTMLGDVLVYAHDEVTLVDTRTQKEEATRLPSVHGSMTHQESDIPLLIDLVD